MCYNRVVLVGLEALKTTSGTHGSDWKGIAKCPETANLFECPQGMWFLGDSRTLVRFLNGTL